ncbi:hypothetical protein ACFC19_02280 [Streptomyces sp. NPDC056127]|uniref:hypothetical protein n=1 Tax=Streptomyces sp. NPDC056127 TaxID=3345720 RepID=UPI0035D7C0B3
MKETGLTAAVQGLAPLDRVHAIAVCRDHAAGRTRPHPALEQLESDVVRDEQMGYLRPYRIT